jgi:hypothetical protein
MENEKEKKRDLEMKMEAYVMFVSAMLSNPKMVDEEKASVHGPAMTHRIHVVAMDFISMMGFTEL